MTSIFIATPMYGGMASGIYTKSLLESFIYLSQKGYTVKYADLYNESLITRARNTLTHLFLKSDCEYLLFVDADQSFLGEDIERMVSHKKEIIAAAVPMKNINWESIRQAVQDGKENFYEYSGSFNVNSLEDNPTGTLSEPLEVKYVGTGMMLIHKNVFEKISKLVDEYSYDSYSSIKIEYGELIKEFWKTSIDPSDNRLLSEDFNFCKMLRDKGGKVFIDLQARVSHLGAYLFNGKVYR